MSNGIKKHISNADVPRPSNDELVQMCSEVTAAIEKCGASPELTAAVIKASDLYYALTKAEPTAAPQSAQDDFCDGHCTWRNHHPECVRADENAAPDWSASAVDRINVLEQRIAELEAAASEQEKAAVPEGWKLVPVEPTDAMQAAGAQAIRFDTTLLNKLWTGNKVFREMVAAAPTPNDR